MIGELLLAQALDQLDGHAMLSPVEGRWVTPAELREKLQRELPAFLEAPVRLTVNKLAYVSLNGESIGGWTIKLVETDPCASVSKTLHSGHE